MPITIRPIDRARDRAAVATIDTSFETDTIFEVVAAARGLTLVERRLDSPRTKRYSLSEAFAAWSSWDFGLLAEVDGVPGAFAAVEYEAWHSRLVLWHLYVTRSRRREGLGRLLLTELEAHGRMLGAHTIWLETTSVNAPGIAAYERLGFALCGADVTVYDTLPYADEAAIYLSKPLGD
jgi:ribosomal protein S18 acetylase RimI-like enzyme